MEPKEISMAGQPRRALDVSGKVGSATLAYLSQDDGRLVGVRGWRVGQLRRILHKAGNDGQNRAWHWLNRKTVLRAGKPVGVSEAGEDRVLALDAAVACIAIGADGIAGFAGSEQIGEAELHALLHVFVVETGFEA